MNVLSLCDLSLYLVSFIIVAGCIYVSMQTRFIQIRRLPLIFKTLLQSFQKKDEGAHTISPFKALFTAMSTTVGIATIVGPIIAVCLGGPGALLGFLFASIFGSAATYLEVKLSVRHRKKTPSGKIMGGAMYYIKELISKRAARWYAFFGFFLMMIWSSAQANQVAAVLNSKLMGSYQIPTWATGSLMALIVLFFLLGGIKKIGDLEAKLIPLKFFVYVGSCIYILACNVGELGGALSLIFKSALSPVELATGTVVGGLFSALRYGIFKGIQISEAGVGTQAIPHAMAETDDPETQATLAMVSTYASGFIAFLSGLVILVTGTWNDPNLTMGISMMAASFEMYFSTFGLIAIVFCAAIFSFGTILGNGFNGSQIFGYLTNGKKISYYYTATALLIFLGAVMETKLVWALGDIFLACIAVPHMASLAIFASRGEEVTPKIA